MEIIVYRTTDSGQEHRLRITYTYHGRYLPATRTEPAEYPEREVTGLFLIRNGRERSLDVADWVEDYADEMEEAAATYGRQRLEDDQIAKAEAGHRRAEIRRGE